MSMILDWVLRSEGAHTLLPLVQDLARQWTEDAPTCDDVNAVFDALRYIIERATPPVATEWNKDHDMLRKLPPEVQELCLGSLPISDRCRLPLVCSHWKQNITNLPGVWNRLHLTDWGSKSAALLARSGRLPLDLTVDVRGDLTPWEFMLRSHACRLRALELHIQGNPRISLALPAPLLEKLSISAECRGMLELSGDLFDKHAPRLCTLLLSRISVPTACPALSVVTDLTLLRNRAPLNHLFDVMPRLEVLYIDMDRDPLGLPVLPRSSPLRILRLLDGYVSIGQLVQLGYSRLEVLDVTTTTSNTSQFVDALCFWSESPATVRVRADWEFEIVPQPENGRRVRFAVRPYKWDIFHQIFCEGRATLHHVQRLALPMSYGHRLSDPLAPVLLFRDSVLTLPGLRTLVLECGGMRPGDKASPLRKCILGMIEAPQHTRVEIVRAADAPWDAQLDPVDIEELVALVENVLVCDDLGALEIFVDIAAGIVFGGDVDLLRKCVGRVIV